ncbi:acylphosphatase [Chitinolyticbacter meiyuanensis]|uniref:acylphosphatase n=1 Tax=Chitinolyticbacter meiyuanensis TaxID=682798 RepID=UPI0011E5E15D|nr:acylphosphatase [Chitinolyticbacter meiyuanensis]
MIAIRLQIEGRVQGVGFRFAACLEAERLGVAGWVRNRHDGSVELHAEGEEPLVEALAQWAHHGPPGARVEKVQRTSAQSEDLGSFRELPTI